VLKAGPPQRPSLGGGANVQWIGIALPASQSLNKVIRNSLPCCYCSSPDPKAVAGEVTRQTSRSHDLSKPWSEKLTGQGLARLKLKKGTRAIPTLSKIGNQGSNNVSMIVAGHYE